MALLASSSCVKKDYPPGREVVADVQVRAAPDGREPPNISHEELKGGLATARSPRFLGIWEGVAVDYEVFDEHVLARDLERVERYYQARGYYEAKAIAGRVLKLGNRHVEVQIAVQPGQMVHVREVSLPGLEALPFDVAFDAKRAVSLCGAKLCGDDEPFDEAEYERSREQIERTLKNHGHAFAHVTADAEVDLATHSARVSYSVQAGPRARYGSIRIEGLSELPEGPIRNSLLLEEGDPYSLADLDDARRALEALGVFSTVEIRADTRAPETGRVPVTIAVRESSLRAVRAGIGARIDQLEVTNTLRVGWESRNFLGGLRRFQIDTRPGVTYFPTRFGRFELPTHYFRHNRLRAELRQPSFIEGRLTGFVSGEYNIYPLLFPIPEGVDPQDEFVIGYHEIRARTGLERRFFAHRVQLVPSYNWQANFPVIYKATSEQGSLPDGLRPLRVSYPELEATLDLRDDPIATRRGVWVTNSFQVAGYIFRGQVSDVRIRPEARGYLPVSRRVTLATRVGLGFLFPSNYGDTLRETIDGVPVVVSEPRSERVVRDQHALLFRAFYSGGPNSNRGYGFREVGPHGPVGFLLRGGNVNCFAPSSAEERAQCIRPLGGVLLWETSLELRYPITGPLTGVTFLDASHVNRSMRWRFDAPHLSPGIGLRYSTPIGPVRFDVGYRLLEHVGSKPTPEQLQDEAQVAPLFGVAPIAVQIALGEAF